MNPTSYEKEHNIPPGTSPTRSDILQETPDQKDERVERDIEEGLRAPKPETVDVNQSTVTGEQAKAFADAAPHVHNPAKDEKAAKDDKKHSPAHHSSKK
jgi:hypothetical protein